MGVVGLEGRSVDVVSGNDLICSFGTEIVRSWNLETQNVEELLRWDWTSLRRGSDNFIGIGVVKLFVFVQNFRALIRARRIRDRRFVGQLKCFMRNQSDSRQFVLFHRAYNLVMSIPSYWTRPLDRNPALGGVPSAPNLAKSRQQEDSHGTPGKIVAVKLGLRIYNVGGDELYATDDVAARLREFTAVPLRNFYDNFGPHFYEDEHDLPTWHVLELCGAKKAFPKPLCELCLFPTHSHTVLEDVDSAEAVPLPILDWHEKFLPALIMLAPSPDDGVPSMDTEVHLTLAERSPPIEFRVCRDWDEWECFFSHCRIAPYGALLSEVEDDDNNYNDSSGDEVTSTCTSNENDSNPRDDSSKARVLWLSKWESLVTLLGDEGNDLHDLDLDAYVDSEEDPPWLAQAELYCDELGRACLMRGVRPCGHRRPDPIVGLIIKAVRRQGQPMAVWSIEETRAVFYDWLCLVLSTEGEAGAIRVLRSQDWSDVMAPDFLDAILDSRVVFAFGRSSKFIIDLHEKVRLEKPGDDGDVEPISFASCMLHELVLRIKDPGWQPVCGLGSAICLAKVLQEIVGIDVLQGWEMNDEEEEDDSSSSPPASAEGYRADSPIGAPNRHSAICRGRSDSEPDVSSRESAEESGDTYAAGR